MDVTVDFSGPLFDGRAEAALADFQEEAVREIAYQGYADVRFALDRVLEHPKGRYENEITVERTVGTDWMIHDGGIRYGPWLEGVSERNRSTRFKGYGTFRLVGQKLQEKAPEMAERILDRYIERMN